MRPILVCWVAALVAAASSAAWAQDIEKGRKIAESYCSRCHDVGPDGKMKQDPPSFAAIAVYRSPDQIYARILAPHVPMPKVVFSWDWMVSRVSVEDVVAYIVSLDKTAK